MKHKSKVLKKAALTTAAIALSTALVAPVLFNALNLSADAAGYQSAHSNRKSLYEADKELNLRIAEESAVLLKNRDSALPLSKDKRDVTVFHSISNSIVGYFGADENYMISALHAFTQFKADAGESNPMTIYQGFDDYGINYNPVMKRLYDQYSYYTDGDNSASGINTRRGPNLSVITQAEKSFNVYRDAAIITITRVGVEGYDGLRLQDPSEGLRVFDPQEGEHYLQLNEGEKKLFDYAKQNFDKVIVLLNTPMPIEMAELQDDDEVDAVLWIGYGGWNGFLAIGELLTGAVNPSGRLVDTWAADITKDPTYQNFYNNSQVSKDGKPHYSVLNAEGAATKYVSVDYAEGIYMGYKFYETAADIGYFDDQTAPSFTQDKYYNRTNGVVYPFGYGLSYTSFTQKIVENSKKTDGDKIEFEVEVTNTGSVAGKDVVQVYYNPPYTKGGIEKATANLVAFAKTDTIKPGASGKVKISFAKRDMASYDYNDKNNNELFGYELEKGSYEISLNKNSHEEWEHFTYEHASDDHFDTDSNSGNKIEQLFSGDDMYNTDRSKYSADGKGIALMTREEQEDGTNGFKATFPKTAGDVTFSQEAIEFIDRQYSRYSAEMDEESDPYYVADEDIPESWTQAADGSARTDGYTSIQLREMTGIDPDSDEAVTSSNPLLNGKTGKEAWEVFMNQLTWVEMAELVSNANFQTIAMDAIGKPRTVDNDGPAQIGTQTYACMNFACGTNIASTWNVELAEEYGKLMGDHAINEGITGWYGPGLNIHRNPYGGRNYEYFSEDGVLAGYIAAYSVKGAVSKGVVTYIKHFALNNQEESRHDILTWASEQTMREIYLKPFELAVKLGGATGVMDSFNNIGGIPACENYNLNVALLTKEWGFKGLIITDAYGDSGWPGNLIVRSQVLPLGYYGTLPNYRVDGEWSAEQNRPLVGGTASATQYYAVRTAAQRCLYAVANSNGMNSMNVEVDLTKFKDLSITFKQGQGGYIPLKPSTSSTDILTYGDIIMTGGDSSIQWDPGVDAMTPTGESVTPGVNGDGWWYIVPGVQMHKGGDTLYDTPVAGHWEVDLAIRKGPFLIHRSLSVTVLSAFEVDRTSGTQGADFSAQVGFVEGSAINSISSCTASGLPEGLSVSNTGAITGRSKAAGEHKVTFTINGKYEFETTLTFAAKDTLTVDFDYNYAGSTGVSSEVASGSKVARPTDPTRDGYRFGGWFEDADCTREVNFESAITEAKTYYAKWTEIPPLEIGDNGHWFIDGKDTGIPAEGEKGAPGAQGEKGETGAQGPQGEKGETGAPGTNGKDGKDGVDGKDGKDGVTPTIEIGDNGNWFINGQDTGVSATGGGNGGCGGVIGIGSAIVAAMTMLGAGVLVLRKRK